MPDISFSEGFFALTGVGLACIYNFMQRKPINTGIYKHIGLAVGGFFFGGQMDRWNLAAKQKKLLMLEDYVRLHPEDFIEPAPKKYKDILMPWTPNR